MVVFYGHGTMNHQLIYPGYTDNGGDILIMKLKFTSSGGILSFKINNDEEFIAYNKIEMNEKLQYRLAISMGANKLSVTLL